ncbi:unnamed protein product [Bursaphelenchus xylophilus]|uniref:(pine wood nematode) hypothetical protein n=1 Tax=Bursaphelenchus xylophilus TaxID=6326 RepID=A0A1I7RS34_BURXY|nr:unnamed protein product [Bursaphelenchus xylophilus]CAG9123265.1 unnamed protein product [Bursaphelenchus xylophilus]
MPAFLWLLFSLIEQYHANCNVNGKIYEEGVFWLHQYYFNVTCYQTKIRVINCLTDLGTVIPLGTLNFEENGFNYTCKNRSANGHAPNLFSPLEQIAEAEECQQGQAYYTRERFVMSCESNQIIGCSDAFGDLVKEGFFVGDRMSLWYCYVYKNKRRAKVERRGCFNGSETDDPSDERYHMKKGQLWKQPTTTLRCEDNGLQVYKCHPSPKESPHVGTAWFDKDNVLNFCQFN